MLKKVIMNMVKYAKSRNDENILSLIEADKKAIVIDLGCDDGEWSSKIRLKTGAKYVYGVDVADDRLLMAKKRGVRVAKADLNGKIPFARNYFDIVHANQVIEHIHDLTGFLNEIHRILKPTGYVIISTENLSSWHNAFSLLFGWQPFSVTNVVAKSIGNPLALFRNTPFTNSGAWCHDKVLAYRGWVELFEYCSFKVETIRGSGYYPLPAFLGDLDKRHCHWISFKLSKIL